MFFRMVGKNTIKLVKSLSLKKFRIKENLFIVEGDKNISEVLDSDFQVETLFATQYYLEKNNPVINKAKQVVEVPQNEIEQLSLLKTPQNSIALCRLPETKKLPEKLDSDLAIYLDDIQDPGNLGTIIRICDWFGIKHLFCSAKTADLFNPKVIQASMGSFCRINLWYTPFEAVARLAAISEVSVLGAFLEGENIYNTKLPSKALLVMGNEGNGICREIEEAINQKIMIPGFNQNRKSAESLNVSVATAIICSEFKRQNNFPGYSK